MKKYITLIILLLTGITGCSQDSKPTEIHGSYRKAIQLLQQSKKQLQADSLLIETEYNRVLRAYANVSDSLKNHAPDSSFAGFETQRLINLCYAAESVEKLQHQQRNLFGHLGKCQDKLSNLDSIHDEVAKCIVNSYEKQPIWFEDTLLHYVTTAMQQHLDSLDAGSWKPERKQDFVNIYAAQYYKRGIVSMAEPVFRHFRRFYEYNMTSSEQLVFSEDYTLYSANLKPTEKKIGQLIKGRSILLFVNEESPFHLIYLIKIMRTAPQAFPSTPVVVLWDGSKVSSAYMKALRRNLSKPKYYVAGLSDKDSKTAEKYASFTAQGKNGKLQFATNNPIDFQEWLEKPLKEHMEAKKKQLRQNYYRLKKRKDSIAALPVDSTLNYTVSIGPLSIPFRGNWNSQAKVRIKQHAFTSSVEKNDFTSYQQLATLEVYDNDIPHYIDFIPQEKEIDIDLMRTPQNEVKAIFKDSKNYRWNKSSQAIDSLMQISNAYDNLLKNYPFQESKFIHKISRKSNATKNKIDAVIENAKAPGKALLSFKYHVITLSMLPPADSISFNDLNSHYPLAAFDTVIWYSPYYKPWLNTWLNYGANDLPNAIDQAFGYWKVVPDEATEEVGQYIWDRLNAMGRFDALVHLDTTWLAGCSDTNQQDVKKRIEGYKRMAPGKKAPNISWKSNGEKMDLHSLEADSIMIVFWSDDCSYCKEKLPEMYHRYGDSKYVEVIVVAVDNDDSSLKAGKKFMPNWHHVWAKEGWEDELIELYNVFGTPEMYILDGDYKILSKSI
ncbi:MAG: peroxiredoxin family protein [Bacteroidota bacterium]